jgi:hypothetical protein
MEGLKSIVESVSGKDGGTERGRGIVGMIALGVHEVQTR